jgi:hypothetical protein
VEFRQASARVRASGPPPYVTLSLNQQDYKGEVPFEGSDEVRLRLFFSRPVERGGKGTRRPFEAILERDNAGWHCRLAARDRQDVHIVSRWNEAESMTNQRGHHDFPEMPKMLDIGLADAAHGARWFLRCHLRHSRTKGDIFMARLENVRDDWPKEERPAGSPRR